MRKIKTGVAFLLIYCTLIAAVPQSMAETPYTYEPEAWLLHRLGLYTGTSAEVFIPDLGAKLDRQIGVALLLNFFGKRVEVLNMSSTEADNVLARYSDSRLISPWARRYMAYAVKNGIVKGTSASTLGPLDPLDGTAFATMILRRLGYGMEGKSYLTSLKTLSEKGGLNAPEVSSFNKQQMLKNDAVGMIYTALYASCSTGEILIENMVRSGAVPADKAFSQKLVRYNNPNSIEAVSAGTPAIPRPTAYDRVYYMILDALYSQEDCVYLPITAYTDTAGEVFEIVEKCVWDNPEILYYAGCTYSSSGKLTFQYNRSKDISKNHSELLLRKLDSILDQIIQPDMSDYEKELAIHDYIINNCDYDLAGYEAGEIPTESFNAYGALCLETAVCEGYAEAAKLLLDRTGVDCYIVTGSSRNVGHAWNIVKVNGEYYQLDVTWDDPVMQDGSRALNYHYFNLTDDEMKIDHEWDNKKYPVCSGTELNYYTYNNLTVPGHKEFVDFVVDRVGRGTHNITVKVENYKSIGFDCSKAAREACGRLYLGCNVSFNENQGIVDMRFN